MAATATHTGPIGIDLINSTVYVWGTNGVGFATIQAAVDFVRTQTYGVGVIEIVHGHPYGENISAITGGDVGMYIVDQRDIHNQRYFWNGTQFVPQEFVQLSGYVAEGTPLVHPGSLSMGFDPTGTAGTGDGNIGVTATATGAGLPSINFNLGSSDGITQSIDIMRLGADPSGNPTVATNAAIYTAQGIVIKGAVSAQANALILQEGAGIGYVIGCGPSPTVNGELVLGTVTSDGSNPDNVLQLLGDGDGHFYNNLIVDKTLTATAASFTLCNVGGKPVIATWPPSGIAVSTGTAWGTSIDPLTLQGKLTLTTTGSSGPATLVGTTLNIPQYAGGGMVFPASGIGVSTGSAWGTSLVAPTGALVGTTDVQTLTNKTLDGVTPATMAFVDPTSSIQTQLNSKQGTLTLTTTGTSGAATLVGATLNVPNYTPAAQVYPGAGIGVSTGSAWGASIAAANVPLLNAANTFTQPQNFNSAIFASANVGSQQIQLGGASDNGQTCIRADGTKTFLDAQSGNLQLNVLRGGTPSITINGTLFANGAKNFKIPHPLDDTKELIHSCLEGPEVGVYYRGEAVVVDGYAVVTLPDYFEALTYPDDRSVQLTQIHEGTPLFARYAASRIVDGKFTIQATENVTMAWEVKAVRRVGVDRLQVVQEKAA